LDVSFHIWWSGRGQGVASPPPAALSSNYRGTSLGAGRDAPYSAWTRGKSALDQITNVPHWTLHDLRRTGATLMERAGVLPHVIEATLGHTIPGVAGVYRRHNFIDEKRAALEALAGLVAQIVEGNAT